MNLKNNQKVDAAEKVLQFAKAQGFADAFLTYETEAEDFYADINSISSDYEEGDQVEIKIHLILDEELEIEVVEDDEISYK